MQHLRGLIVGVRNASLHMIFAISLSKPSINKAYRENMVDYANETECFYMFRYFDKDKDGYLDYDEYSYYNNCYSFLQLTLPCDDLKQRAEIA